MLDTLITGATVVDGTGAPGRVAAVGVRDGRIAAVGATDEPARRRVDATGLVLAPGAVDIHTHYDAQLFWDPTASPSLAHGVTTVIGGNCGFSLAPAGPDHADYLMRMMARVEGMPLAALEAGLPWDWAGFADWLARLDGRVAVNAGFLVGHSPVRRVVMDDDAVGRTATPAEVAAMADLVADALAAGALGFSTSRGPAHHDGDGNPVPSRAAADDELMALASVLRRYPGTTLELIMAGSVAGFRDDEIELMAALSRAAGCPANWNLLTVEAPGGAHWGQLAASDEVARRGGRLVALVLPSPQQVWMTFRTGFALDAIPGWRELFAMAEDDRLRALTDPGVRAGLAEGAARAEGLIASLARFERLILSETFTPGTAPYQGRTVGEVAAERGQPPLEALLDVVVADGLRTGLSPPVGGAPAEWWAERAEVWLDERTVVGGSDAGAHVEMMCGAVYSTFLLGEAVRERGLLTIEQAVHQLTDVPACLYGLRGRGRVAEGWAADLVLFDPETVGPGPLHTRHDLPAGAARLYAEAEGVEAVVVNGVEVMRAGRPTGATPGTLLRSGRDTETVPVGAAQTEEAP